MSQFIDTANLDFIAYRNSLKTYLQNQSIFKDYDFEGSNFAILLDLLSYNATYEAYYENMIGSEMFLDTALLKDSVVSKSKELNYIPRSRSSARTDVSISINTGGQSPSSITIPKYYNISAVGTDANNNNKTFNFVTNTAIVVQSDSFGNYNVANVEIYEGSVVKEVYYANSATRYIMQSNTIDIDSINVVIVNSNTDNTSTVWNQTLDIYGINSTSNIFFIQGAFDNKYEIVFGNGTIGRSLSNGNIVNISYISTSGEDGNGLVSYSPTVAVESYPIVAIVPDEASSGGSERETIDSIKFHGPRHFTTQERAVTDTDFENLVREKFPIVQSVRAYGGELLNPPQYGRVAIFVKPFGKNGIISDNVKNNIVNFLAGKSITTKAFIVDPEYFYIQVNCEVTYDPSLLDIPLDQLKSNVIIAINNFGVDNLTDFDSDLRYSKFINAIDDVHPSIVSNDTSVAIIKRWSPSTGSIQNLTFSYGSQLRQYDITTELDLGIEPTLTSSIFSYVVNGISYSAKIEDNGIGTLKVIANNTAKNVLNSNVGSIDYTSGNIEINLNVSSYSGYISLYAAQSSKDVEISENRFLILDTIDTTVTMNVAT